LIVITRNGKTVMLTGWRAWLAVAVFGLIAAFGLVVIAFIALGATLTFAALIIVAVPLAILFTLLAALWQAVTRRY
jgi:hypothetical protein